MRATPPVLHVGKTVRRRPQLGPAEAWKAYVIDRPPFKSVPKFCRRGLELGKRQPSVAVTSSTASVRVVRRNTPSGRSAGQPGPAAAIRSGGGGARASPGRWGGAPGGGGWAQRGRTL